MRQKNSKMRNRRQERTKAKRTSSRAIWGAVKRVGWGLGVAVTVWSGIALYHQFTPNLTISALSPLNPSDPFSTPFVISNDSLLPIYDVTIKCRLIDVKYVDQSLQVSSNTSWAISDAAKKIDRNESITALCHLRGFISVKISRLNDTEMMISHADIAVIMSFRQNYTFWLTEKPFRFVTAKSADGQLRWIRQPMNQ